MLFRFSIVSIFLCAAFFACNSNRSRVKEKTDSIPSASLKDTLSSSYVGNYVTADYAQRAKGYDWVSVSISPLQENKIQIRVRSRADIKKPTCTLDAEAQKVESNVYRTNLSGSNVLFEFKNDQLIISAADDKNASALYFYCSGGTTLAGSYLKTQLPLDTLGK